jgi:hypothetical protein
VIIETGMERLMSVLRFLGASLLLGVLGAVVSYPAPLCGQFTLVEADKEAFQAERSRSGVIRFEPVILYEVEEPSSLDQQPGFLPLSTVGLDPEEDWDLIEMAKTPIDWKPRLTTGALVALPGVPSNWDLSVSPPSAESAVSVSEAVVGTVPCLHIVIDREALGTPGSLVTIELQVDAVPNPGVPRQSVTAENMSARMARSIFLNAESMETVPLGSSGVDASGSLIELPNPPGDTRITYRQGSGLVSFPLSDLGEGLEDAGSIALYHHGDKIPAVAVVGDNLLVYAPRRETLTDNNDSIFATVDEGDPSPAIQSRSAFVTLAPVSSEFAQSRSQLYDIRNIGGRYERAAILPLEQRFVGYRIAQTQSVNTPLPVYDYLTSATVFMQVRLLGLTSNTPINPDHFADVSLQGVALPRIEWDGRSQVTRFQSIELPVLPNPTNLTFSHAVPGMPGLADSQNFRDVTLAWTGYPRINSAGRTAVQLTATGAPRLVTIGGFPVGTTASDVMVLDITNPKAPVRLTSPHVFTDTTGTVAVQFEAPAAAGVFFAQRVDAAEVPQVAVPAETLPIASGPEELLGAIYVRVPVLAASLAPLVASQTDAVIELDPQAAYNAYNGGQQDPNAIRSAVRDLLDAAPQRVMLPRLVLVGDASFDRRDYMGLMTTPQVPIYIEASFPDGGIEIENSVDQFYGLLYGNDAFEDVQVARLPVKTTGQLDIIVGRALAHAAISDDLSELDRLGLFVADDPRPNEFVDYRVDSHALANLWVDSGKPSSVVELTGSKNPAFSQVKAFLEGPNGGVAMMMYTGHGNTNVWGDESFLVPADLPTLNTENKWPLITTFSCLSSYFAGPIATADPLGKLWITTPTVGAVATITPSGPEPYFPQFDFSVVFVEEARQPVGFRPESAGEAFTRARIRYLTKYPGSGRTARTYLYFGDPASNLTMPASVDYDFLRIY